MRVEDREFHVVQENCEPRPLELARLRAPDSLWREGRAKDEATRRRGGRIARHETQGLLLDPDAGRTDRGESFLGKATNAHRGF